jgi:general secretion pathway protein F
VPNFRYRALTQKGEIVHGTLSAPTAAEVAHRIEYLQLLPIETIEETRKVSASGGDFGVFNRPSAAEVTTFTRDLALLLKAGARLDDALELLASDTDVGRLRPVVGKLRAALLSGESLAAAVADHPALFPPMYIALVRVGEVSGTLDQVLEMLGAERARAELMRRKLTDAMQYPTFVLIAAICVMLFFILFVLPQFSSVLQDFGAKSDSALSVFIRLSDFLRANATVMMLASASAIAGVWWLLRRPGAVAAIVNAVSRIPGIAGIFKFYRTTLFCRNLGVLLSSGVNLSATLRILVDIMAVTGNVTTWAAAADRVRHGGKLSDALSADGGAHAAAWRGNRPIARAGGPGRRILRGETAAQPGSDRGHHRAARHRHHQFGRGRADRIGYDRAAVCHSTCKLDRGLGSS